MYEWPELADDSVDCVRVLEVVLDCHTKERSVFVLLQQFGCQARVAWCFDRGAGEEEGGGWRQEEQRQSKSGQHVE